MPPARKLRAALVSHGQSTWRMVLPSVARGKRLGKNGGQRIGNEGGLVV
jgi:hypothetical protein